MLGSWCLLVGLAAAGSGWLGDGSARWPDATPPTQLTSESVRWTTPLDAWSNASPVVLGDRVCVQEEPVSLVCLAVSDGHVLWRRDHPVLGALPAAQREAISRELRDFETRYAALSDLLREQSRLRRVVRSGTSADAAEGLAAISKQISELQREAITWADHRTPPDKQQIGYSSSTPATDGEHLYALFGNGVLASWTSDGTLRWSRWLGPPPTPMDGYTLGTSASPLVVGNALVVGYDRLRGVSLADGSDLWVADEYRAYGSPAVSTVGGRQVLITPGGTAHDPLTGRVLAEGLGEVYFVGPVAHGDDVWFVGGRMEAHVARHGLQARRVKLSWQGETLVVTEAWKRALPGDKPIYAQPLWHRDRVFVHDDQGHLTVLDAASGASVHEVVLPDARAGHMSAAVAAGSVVIIGSERGHTCMLTDAGQVSGCSVTEGYRSVPTPHGDVLYLRTFGGLVAYGR